MDAVRVTFGVFLLVGCCLGIMPAIGAGETIATTQPDATLTTQPDSNLATTQPDAGPTPTQPDPDLMGAHDPQTVTPTTGLQRVSGTEATRQTGESDDLTLTTTLDRTPETSGEIGVTVAVSIPDRVTQLTAAVPDRARVGETEGFSHDSGDSYTWDGATATPTITYRVDPNRLSDREGPLSVDGQYLFADTDDWALVRIPQTGITGRYTGSNSLELDRETVIDGPGVAGDRMAFLGPVDVRTRQAHGQTFRLVIPEAADLEAEPGEILGSVSNAADRLQVGDRDEEVLMIAAPTGEVGWTVRGLQVGESDFWVRDSEGLDTASNVWVHEYVHTRQEYTAAPSAEWVTEGSATYYAALLPLETGRIDFEAFRRQLATGAATSQRSVVLSDPDRWDDFANYRKGALVAGDLDRRIRLATDREATFDQVLRELNTAAEPIDDRAVRRAVSNAAGRDVAVVADRYTTTTAGPSMWNSTAHAAAFGGSPAQFSYRLADDDPVTVEGPTRTTVLNGRELAVTTGETLRVRLTVENVGGTAGDYELPFRVNETETVARGRLGPGEQATHSFERTFTEPGTYQLTAGVDAFVVRVTAADDPAGGGTINSTPPPVFDDDGIEGTAGNETSEEDDENDETADNATGEDTGSETETTDDGTTDDNAPGFGVGVATVALALSLVAFSRRPRD